MYTIKLKYIKPGTMTPIEMTYIVPANSYEEAVELIKVEADKRVNVMGGTIVSII